MVLGLCLCWIEGSAFGHGLEKEILCCGLA